MSSQEEFSIKSAEELAEKIAPFIFDASPREACLCADAILVLAALLYHDGEYFLDETAERLKLSYLNTISDYDGVFLETTEETKNFWKKLVTLIRSWEETNET